MKLLLAAACTAATLAATATSAPPPILTGQINLIATVQEHHATGPQHFPTREAWYMSLASTRRKGRPFGYATFVCSFVSARSSLRQCSGTFSLPRGKVVIAGSFIYTVAYQFAVTGGTDTYEAVGGSVSFRQFTHHPANYWVAITLR